MWSWLTDLSSDDWQAIGSMGTLAIAALAALFAKRQVDEARRVRLEQAQPQVILDFETHSVLIMLVIKNTGTTTARAVSMTFDPPLQSTLLESGRTEMLTSKLMTAGIPTMPPGKEFKLLFERGPDWYERDNLPHAYSAVVTYKDSSGKDYEERYTLDLDILYGWRTVGVKGVHDVAQAVTDISTAMKRWTGSQGLNVLSFDGDRYVEEENREIREIIELRRREEFRTKRP